MTSPIVFVLPREEHYTAAWSGAVATVIRNLVRELDARDRPVAVLAPDDGVALYAEGAPTALRYGPAVPRGRVARVLGAIEARIRRFPGGDYAAYRRAVHRGVRGVGVADPTLVAHDAPTARALAGRFRRASVVLWMHNYPDAATVRELGKLPEAVLVVAVSDSVAQAIVTAVPSISPTVVHNAVDHALFHPDGHAPHEPVRVVCHGRIDPNKGQDVVTAAIARLRNDGFPVELTLIGELRTFGFDPAVAEAYDRSVRSSLRASGSRSLGWLAHDALALELRQHDVACAVPRVDEPFGLAALEAMASGCAIVATALGGLPEVVGDAGIYVPPDDADALASAIRSLVGDSLIAARRDAAAAAEAFTWSASVDAFLRALDGTQPPIADQTRA
ncbi:glycosyltransferase family 4 protein [Microbacterium sp. ASV49]|uniref:Glycosyltransferase family 4 protein n=1 Tax=Microbacterium candidum TaxID=3041922 RepID=A0ABT7MUZ3_9MICO|nr:glycosyltransferase family 4 protein [Microbacterium sp. ASV49]MDL9978272.1 glycosyltransferase family 4 protein [Microbacterium sp. ASV49]